MHLSQDPSVIRGWTSTRNHLVTWISLDTVYVFEKVFAPILCHAKRKLYQIKDSTYPLSDFYISPTEIMYRRQKSASKYCESVFVIPPYLYIIRICVGIVVNVAFEAVIFVVYEA